jgi:Domain of unknown function DUF11/Putative Ig domain
MSMLSRVRAIVAATLLVGVGVGCIGAPAAYADLPPLDLPPDDLPPIDLPYIPTPPPPPPPLDLPPAITPSVVGTLGNNGWYISNVTVSFLLAGAASSNGCETRTITTDGTGTVICFAYSSGGSMSSSIASYSRDATPPTLQILGGPADGAMYGSDAVPAAPTCTPFDIRSGAAGACSITGYSTAVGTHTLTFSAKDNAGNVATETRTYTVGDTTPPVITPLVTGTLGANGWYTSASAISWAVTDNESAITEQSGCGITPISGDTTGTTATCSATSGGGEATQSKAVKVDGTAPSIVIDGGPADSQVYAPADVPGAPTCSAIDETSGVDGECTVDGYSSELGDHLITFSAKDVAGNGATRQVNYTVADRSAPVIEPTIDGTKGANGWYTSNVGVSWDVSDPETRVEDQRGCDPSVVDTDTTGIDVTCAATSEGGVSSKTVTIKRDTTAPSITVAGGPAKGGSYLLGGVPAAPTCSADDPTSGVDGECSVGGYSTALGERTITFSAKDNAGNAATETVTYSVTGAEPSVSGTATSSVVAGAAYSYAYAVGGDPAASVSLASGSLPPGITLSAAGTLGGSSTVAGSYAFTVKATNAVGTATSGPQVITVSPAAVAEVSVIRGDAQNAAPGASFAKPLTVRSTDAYGNGVDGQKVTFTASSAVATVAGAASKTLVTTGGGYSAVTLKGVSKGTVRVTAALSGKPTIPAVVFSEAVLAAGTAKANLAVSISGLPASLQVGASATVTVRVKNLGTSAAAGVLTTLDPSDGVTVTSATGGTIAALGTAASWTASSLASGATLSYTAKIKAVSRHWTGGSCFRSAAISTTADPALANNFIAPTLTITAPASIE